MMKKLLTRISLTLNNAKGQGMVEYGLIIALVAIVVVGALILLGGNITGIFNNAASAVSH